MQKIRQLSAIRVFLLTAVSLLSACASSERRVYVASGTMETRPMLVSTRAPLAILLPFMPLTAPTSPGKNINPNKRQ